MFVSRDYQRFKKNTTDIIENYPCRLQYLCIPRIASSFKTMCPFISNSLKYLSKTDHCFLGPAFSAVPNSLYRFLRRGWIKALGGFGLDTLNLGFKTK